VTSQGPSRGDGAIALQWWEQVCSPKEGDPASRARLRRCRSYTDALTIEAAVRLARRLGAVKEPIEQNHHRIEAALGLARVLSHVSVNGPRSAMRAAGWSAFPGDRSEGDADPAERPRLSEARFRRLLLTLPGEEQVTMFVRLARLLGGEVNVQSLALDYLNWHRESTKRRWAVEYYAAAVQAQSSDSPILEVIE